MCVFGVERAPVSFDGKEHGGSGGGFGGGGAEHLCIVVVFPGSTCWLIHLLGAKDSSR